VDENGQRVSAFRTEHKHMNGGNFLHGGAIMTFADYAIFVIARDALQDGNSVTASFNGDFVGSVPRRPGGVPRRSGAKRPEHGLRARPDHQWF